MRSASKQLFVILGSFALFGCAASGGEGQAQEGGMKMAAMSCMNQVDAERQQCEDKCPKATGNEHFSVQHRLAMEHAACKQECAESVEQRSMSCKQNR